jgi:hypothetical protein
VANIKLFVRKASDFSRFGNNHLNGPGPTKLSLAPEEVDS